MLLRILAGLLVAGLAAGCSASETSSVTALPDDAVITYAFHDASVPPAYHRSVTLSVTKEQTRLVVDSYGDVLADEETPTPPAVWAELGGTFATVSGVSSVQSSTDCVGGTGIDLTVTSGRQDLVDVSAGACGGSNPGIEKALTAWVAPARDLFPATDVLAPS